MNHTGRDGSWALKLCYLFSDCAVCAGALALCGAMG